MSGKVSDLNGSLDMMLKNAVQGDHAAFEKFYREFSGVVWATITKYVGNVPAVEDLVQTVFIKVYREFPTYLGEKPFRAWLKQACLFTVYDYFRSKRTQEIEQLDPNLGYEEHCRLDIGDSPESRFVTSEIRRLTHILLAKLKPKKRMALIMHDFEGHTMQEVADILGCSKFTVRTRLVRARAELAVISAKNKELQQLLSRSVA